MSDMEEETLDLAGEQGTSTRNPHEMSNADLFSLLKTYMDTRLSGIETSFCRYYAYFGEKDASDTGAAGFIQNSSKILHKMWLETERGNATSTMSIKLYDYLCQNIVGSVDHVRLIRLMNATKDQNNSSNEITTITSGSFGEGLELQGSDTDVMFVVHFIEVTDKKKLHDYHFAKNYFFPVTDDVKPGFAYLRLIEGVTIRHVLLCRSFEGHLYLSSALVKQGVISNRLSVVHGPCVSDKYGGLDYTHCLHSKSWITTASKWVTRSTSSWPTSEVKQTVIDHGVLVQFNADWFFNDFKKISKSKLLITMKSEEPMDYVQNLQLVFSSKTKKLRHISLLNMAQNCFCIAQTMHLSSLHCNKYKYEHYKQCLCYLLQSTHQDAVTGWLMLASFFYEKKQYNKTLYVLTYSLRKCTREKLYFGAMYSDVHRGLFRFEKFRKLGMIRILRILFISVVCFTPESCLIPGEIKLDVDTIPYLLPSVEYIHFLTFLCHYHLYNIRNYQESLGELRLTIEENYFHSVRWANANAYDCLGVAFQIIGDLESAREVFVRSIDLDPDQLMNRSFQRLAMMD
ncbi:unnamed protein product [Mytilus coruscus]|uniref:Uncharacterized protein n=1 Tax=Mytilus coruscus TaxID=42192 RepID=A0A6J8D123_MYTCO|nr:unnamed protein product [Mytilus coruscus]